MLTVHRTLPASELNLPASHLVQALLFASEYVPLAHCTQEPAPAFEYVPLTQLVQFTDMTSLYVPPSHDEHVVALDTTLVWSPAPVFWRSWMFNCRVLTLLGFCFQESLSMYVSRYG